MGGLEKLLSDLYAIIGQYAEYQELRLKLENNQINSCCSCNRNDNKLKPALNIIHRTVLSDKIILKWTDNDKNEHQYQSMKNSKKEMETQITLNTVNNEEYKMMEERSINPNDLQILEISTINQNIYYSSDQVQAVTHGDMLCAVNGQYLDGLQT